MTIGDVTVTEGHTGEVNANFPVTLSSAAPRDVQVAWTTTDGSATAASGDYDGATGTLTIAAGQSGGTIQVKVNGDVIPEGASENFHVDMTSVSGALFTADRRGTATITDDDTAQTITIGDVTVAEGNSGEVNANFPVTLPGNAPSTVQIAWTTTDGSAAAPADYTAATGTLTIPTGQSSGTITIKVKGDTIAEGTGTPRIETFHVDLTSASGAQLGSDRRGTASITDDDTAPTVTSITDPELTEGNDGEQDANFVVTLSSAAQTTVQIGYATADGSATAPADYTGVTGTLTIPTGQSSGTIAIKVKGDTLPEGTENFHVDLTAASAAQLGSDRRGTATIEDNDAQRSISISSVEVNEGTGAGNTANLDFKLRLNGTTAQAVQVIATTSDGTATAPGDYQAKTQLVTWAPNSTGDDLEKTFRVIVNPDSLDEANETVIVTLTAAQNAVISNATGTGLVKDNDNNSLLAVSNAEANEGSGGTTSKMTFKITLAPASARAVTVSYATANGTATAGPDYQATQGQVSFGPGETEKAVEVVILGDEVNEDNETVLLNLSNVAGAGLAGGGGQGSGTIVDKNAPPSLSIDDVQAVEGGGAFFTVTLAGTTLRTVTVNFGTGDGSAKEGTDFLPRSGTLTFAPGDKTKRIEVTVFDDPTAEGAETFNVGLGNPVNATITKANGTGTIAPSDQAEVVGPTVNQPPLRPNTPLPKPPTVTGPTVFPQMVLGPRSVTMRNGRAQMTVTCRKTSKIACAGSILLQTTTKPALKLGQTSFSVKKGKKATVTIIVAKDVRGLIEELRTIKVKVVVFVKTNNKKNVRVDPGTITVRMPTNTSTSSKP